MKKADLFWMAGRRALTAISIILLTGIAAGAYCWCVGGGLAAGVQEQLTQPYELTVTPGSSAITGDLLEKIRQEERVLNASPTIDLQGTLLLGDTGGEITLEGIDAGYLKTDISEGTVFPDKTVMPYVVLNKAGWDMLQEKDEDGEPLKGEAWISSGISVQAGPESGPVSAKICGILDDGQKDAKAYISLSSAKTLAGDNSYTGIVVKAGETRYAEDVSQKISALGLVVQNAAPEEQSGWDEKNREAVYLFLLGSAVLFYSAYLYLHSENPADTAKRNEFEMLRFIGFCASDLTKFFLIKTLVLIGISFAFGLMSYTLVPQLIPPDIREQINIAFPVNTSGLLAGAGASLAVFFFAGVIQGPRFKRLCG